MRVCDIRWQQDKTLVVVVVVLVVVVVVVVLLLLLLPPPPPLPMQALALIVCSSLTEVVPLGGT
jgi:hypothetical protein